jgi:hypothetical protein
VEKSKAFRIALRAIMTVKKDRTSPVKKKRNSGDGRPLAGPNRGSRTLPKAGAGRAQYSIYHNPFVGSKAKLILNYLLCFCRSSRFAFLLFFYQTKK